MRVLMKETLTLHKVLSKYLAVQAVEVRVCSGSFRLFRSNIKVEIRMQFIMSQVFAAINHRLSEEYAKIELPSQEAKERFVLLRPCFISPVARPWPFLFLA